MKDRSRQFMKDRSRQFMKDRARQFMKDRARQFGKAALSGPLAHRFDDAFGEAF